MAFRAWVALSFVAVTLALSDPRDFDADPNLPGAYTYVRMSFKGVTNGKSILKKGYSTRPLVQCNNLQLFVLHASRIPFCSMAI